MLNTLTVWLIEKAFYAAPLSVLPLLNANARMDIVDLYRSKQPAVVENAMGGESRLRKIDNHHLAIQLTPVSRWEMLLLPDSSIEVRHTYMATDTVSSTSLYDKHWKLLCKDRK